MCGRLALTKMDPEGLKRRFCVMEVDSNLHPRYNIPPGSDIPVILNTEPEAIRCIRWGLIPHWAKDPSIGQRLINARAETVSEKPAFRGSLHQKRCLVITDTFYEWRSLPNGGKQPYRIMRPDGDWFALAGLWDEAVLEGGESIRTCTIITTSANETLAAIHDRMPVVLEREEERIWLSSRSLRELMHVLHPPEPDALTAYPIASLINSPSNDTPEVLRPVSI